MRSASERLRRLLLRRAMSMTQAKEILGFPPSANPSKDEIEKAYKKKALENHPDLGGDAEKMKEINVARDVLEGRQRPTNEDSGGGWRSREDYGPSSYTPPPRRERPQPKPVHVSFEEAMQAAHVPTSGVEWLFETEPGFGGYGDTSHSGFVVYGKSDTQHIFVGVEQLIDRGDMFEPRDVDKHTMYVKTAPLTQPLASVGPTIIRDLWEKFGKIKQYNAKVRLLEKGIHFKDINKYSSKKGRPVSFKQAVDLLGEQTPTSWKGKVEITLELSGQREKLPGMGYDEYRPTLVINGREYALNDKALVLVEKNDVYRKMWGKSYYYGQSKKVITKMRDKTKWLTLWKQICEKAGERDEVIKALEAALTQK